MELIGKTDPQIEKIILQEADRQESELNLIASENIVSQAVMAAQGSILTNKYAEGYPARRYYGGCEYVDQAEDLAIERAKKIIQGRICKCPAPLRLRGEYGGLFCSVESRGSDSCHGPFPRRSFNTWRFRQLFR